MRQRGGSEQPVKGRRANRPKARRVSTAAPSVADLQKQVVNLAHELKDANERQTATSEVLQVINSSRGDLAPVFDAMLENAMRLCEASHCHIWRFDGKLLYAVAVRGDPWFAEWLQEHDPIAPAPGRGSDRIARGGHRPCGRLARRGSILQLSRVSRLRRCQWRAHLIVCRATPGRNAAWSDQRLPPGGAAVLGQANRPAAELRRPGRDRN